MTQSPQVEYQMCFNDSTGNILGLVPISREDIMHFVPISGQEICINSADYSVIKTTEHYLTETSTLVFNVEVQEI
jgi:hypothetical protein